MSTEREQMREALAEVKRIADFFPKDRAILEVVDPVLEKLLSEPETDWKARAEKAESAIRSYFYLRNHDMEEATKGMSRVIAEAQA